MGKRNASFTYTQPALILATVRLAPAFAPVTPIRVPWTYRFAGLGATDVATCDCVEPGSAANVTCMVDRLNWHIASPKLCVQDDCHKRRGIWMFRSSRCDRHLRAMPVRLQSISEMRPANRTTVPGLVSP